VAVTEETALDRNGVKPGLGRRTWTPDKDAFRRTRTPDSAAGQGRRTRSPDKDAGLGCRTRTPDSAAGQGRRTR
ncbi:hypothetical protein LSAT2_024410, partial [Lamellibrachia satsuma]